MKHLNLPGQSPRRGGPDLSDADESRQFEREWGQYAARRQRDRERDKRQQEHQRRIETECRWPSCRRDRVDLDRKYTKAYTVPLCHSHFEQVVLVGYRIGIHEPAPIPEPVRREPRQDGYIYYIRVGDAIKIGFAACLRTRLMQYPPNAVFLLAHKGTRADEKDIHGKLLARRSHGKEWYKINDEVTTFIEQQLLKHGSLDDPRPKPKSPPLRSRGGNWYMRIA